MKPYVNSGPEEEYTHQYLRCSNISVLKSQLIKSLFSSSNGDLNSVHLNDLSLPVHPNKVLSKKKIESIRLKIDMFVSQDQRNYYPEIGCNDLLVIDRDGDVPTVKKRKTPIQSKIICEKSFQPKNLNQFILQILNLRIMDNYHYFRFFAKVLRLRRYISLTIQVKIIKV